MRHSLGLGPRREDNYPGRPGNKKQHRQPGLPQSPDTWNQFHKARKVSEKASFLRKDGKGKLFFVLTQIFLHYFSCQTDIIQPGFYRVDILSSLSPMTRLIKDDHSNLIGLAGVLPRSWLICAELVDLLRFGVTDNPPASRAMDVSREPSFRRLAGFTACSRI